MATDAIIVQTEKLTKVYRPMLGTSGHRAVDNLTIDVRQGEIFGLVGPNGSGKTTTLKLLLGLLKATSGDIRVFGEQPRNVAVKHRIGFLPDGPYFYEYMNSDELLDFYGKLFGLPAAVRRKRTDELLALVGLTHARSRPLHEYSKGMMQKAGLAQALINDPDLLFLDEPISGLDPTSQRDVKDIMLELRGRGKTVFLCSHILSDVQALCDRVAIINQGQLVRLGPVRDMLDVTRHFEITASNMPSDTPAKAKEKQLNCTASDGSFVFRVQEAEGVVQVVEFIKGANGRLVHIEEKRETLEDVFVKAIKG